MTMYGLIFNALKIFFLNVAMPLLVLHVKYQGVKMKALNLLESQQNKLTFNSCLLWT